MMHQSKYHSMPITELSNETTIDIDISNSTGIVRILRQCDAQIFSGWRNHPSLYDKETLEPLEKLTEHIKKVLLDPGNSCVVFSGCGTSGRIGFMMSKKFNALAKESRRLDSHVEDQDTSGVYSYIIAGGDVALFSSVELPEDDWHQGHHDLMDVTAGKKKVVFIGISCGLSAPYVAGQLDYCMNNPGVFTPVLLGFNPVHMARKTPIEGTSKTFYDVAKRLSEHKDGIIINPVLGPEAITGSSRMKGGSATIILLETTLIKAHSEIFNTEHPVNPTSLLLTYESVYRETYFHVEQLAKMISHAGASLKKPAHVYYLAWGSPVFVAVLDASECVPTFSASFHDVRAFGREDVLLPGNAGSISIGGSEVDLTLGYFKSSILPGVSPDDTVIFVCLSPNYVDEATEIVKQVSQKGAKTIGVLSHNVPSTCEEHFNVCIKINKEKYIPSCLAVDARLQGVLCQCLDEFAVKLILNAASTGGHVIKGKVMRSLMVDVKISNDKLFRRAVGIVSELARVDEKEALQALLKAIYRKNEVSASCLNDVISNHVTAGSALSQVVPLAILIAGGKFTVESGLRTLEEKTISQVMKELRLL